MKDKTWYSIGTRVLPNQTKTIWIGVCIDDDYYEAKIDREKARFLVANLIEHFDFKIEVK